MQMKIENGIIESFYIERDVFERIEGLLRWALEGIEKKVCWVT